MHALPDMFLVRAAPVIPGKREASYNFDGSQTEYRCSEMAQALILGIDVGGTSTDAVLLNDQGFKAKAKVGTSDDVHGSISNVISSIRDQCDEGAHPARACLVDGME